MIGKKRGRRQSRERRVCNQYLLILAGKRKGRGSEDVLSAIKKEKQKLKET